MLLSYFFIFLMAESLPVQAKQHSNERLMAIKAAYLYRFSLFIDWPEPHLGSFLICVADNSDYSHLIQFNLQNQYIKDEPIEVVSVLKTDDLSACQLLYIPKNIQHSADFLLKAKKNILTLGESMDFYHEQGMIYLYEQDNKIRFFINYEALKKNDFKIRAQLMKLSRTPIEE